MTRPIPVYGCELCGVGRTGHGMSSGTPWASAFGHPKRHTYVAPTRETVARRRADKEALR